jgi:hypothetical protein
VSSNDNLDSIEEMAFSRCSSLNNINFPPHLTKIGDSAFSYCSSLKEIKIPLQMACIGNNVFQHYGVFISVIFFTNISSEGSVNLNDILEDTRKKTKQYGFVAFSKKIKRAAGDNLLTIKLSCTPLRQQ